MDISDLRGKINRLDDAISAAFKERMQVALDIARYKQAHSLPVHDPARERAVIDRLTEGCDDEMTAALTELYQTMFAVSRGYQHRYMAGELPGVFGLIGHPLAHSCSPRVHALLGGEGYQLWDVAPENLQQFFQQKSFDGVNVTIPHKQAVMPLCDALSDTAQQIGSVNTIVRCKDGTLFGDNTDAYGFLAMAQRAGIDFNGKKTLVLGSGGTSRTACAVILAQGGEPVVISRTGENNYGNLHLHADAQLLVNTTPVGMYPHTAEAPVDLNALPNLTGVLDVIYNPLRTRLLQQAEEKGLRCAGGLYMLCAQAARAREVFTGRTIDSETLEHAYQALLSERRNLVLIGMPGSGKTTVGKLLADRLHMPFIDTDALIEAQTGRSIPDIFAQDGECAFREMEQQVISDCCLAGGQVIATGGGVVLREENRKNLRMNAQVVWLTRPLDALPFHGRPLSTGFKAVEDMYALRKPLYRACADITADNSGDIENTLAALLQALHC